VKGFAAADEMGMAFGWLPEGKGAIAYRVVKDDAVSPPHAQGMRIERLDSAGAGLRQPIHLPLHRARDYRVALWAKAEQDGGQEIEVSIRKPAAKGEGKVLVKARLGLVGAEWRRFEATLQVDGAKREEQLDFLVTANRPGGLLLDEITLFPADAVAGFDPDVVRMLKESRLPLLRFPGGNFVSGYHWRDGVGPSDRRPTRVNRPWKMLECNDVGTDEWIAFCRAVGCEPMICVNAGDGKSEDAAAWVEYCNGAPATPSAPAGPMGRLRAANGHEQPYRVKYWEIGNELYGKWQIGHCAPEEYAERYRRFHDAMAAVDPAIKFIANGQSVAWNRPLVEQDADILRSVSIHTLVGQSLPDKFTSQGAYTKIIAGTWDYENVLRRQRDQMAAKVSEPRLALTELQIMIGADHSRYPRNQTIAEALFFSGTLHSCVRVGDFVELITHSALVNHGGGLRKRHELVFAAPVHWAHWMYSTQDCLTPASIAVRGPSLGEAEKGAKGAEKLGTAAAKRPVVPCLDALALTDETGARLSLFVANRHPSQGLTATMRIDGLPKAGAAAAKAEITTLSGDSVAASNSEEHPDAVHPIATTQKTTGGVLTHEFPPLSLTRIKIGR